MTTRKSSALAHRLAGRAFFLLITVTILAGPALGQWTQWGGPTSDFKVDSKGIADFWPEEGPPRLWTRELGDGYSAILADAGRLFTLYRKGDHEIVIALEAATGKTVWEHPYVEIPDPKHLEQFGRGPRATPALCGDRLFTIGVAGQMLCLDRNTGQEIWSHDLWEEFEATFLGSGYCSSPFVYRDTVIVLTGGKGNSIIAFDQEDGSVAWKILDLVNSYSTPRLIRVEGDEQLLCFMASELVAIDPGNGELLWSYAIGNQWGHNISQPIFDDGVLFLSTTYAGARGLALSREGKEWRVEDVWSTPRIQIYHVTAVGLGDHVYASHGNGMGQVSLFTCVNRKTGDVAWRTRGLGKANTLHADGKFILLDEDGMLALVRATPEKCTILSRVKICDGVAWAVPTLVGTTLYVRDTKRLMALDLG